MDIEDCLIEETFYFYWNPELYRLLTTGRGEMKKITEREEIEERIEELKENIGSLKGYIEDGERLIESYRNRLKEMNQLYYVKFFDDEKTYLCEGKISGSKYITGKGDNNIVKAKFTEEEIKEIDSRFWQFAVPVEEEDCE